MKLFKPGDPVWVGTRSVERGVIVERLPRGWVVVTIHPGTIYHETVRVRESEVHPRSTA